MQDTMNLCINRCNLLWNKYLKQTILNVASQNLNIFSFFINANIIDGGIFENNIYCPRIRHALIFQIDNSHYQIVRQMTNNVLVQWNIFHLSGDELDFCYQTPKLHTFFALDTRDYSLLINWLESSPFKKIAEKINNEDCV